MCQNDAQWLPLAGNFRVGCAKEGGRMLDCPEGMRCHRVPGYPMKLKDKDVIEIKLSCGGIIHLVGRGNIVEWHKLCPRLKEEHNERRKRNEE